MFPIWRPMPPPCAEEAPSSAFPPMIEVALLAERRPCVASLRAHPPRPEPGSRDGASGSERRARTRSPVGEANEVSRRRSRRTPWRRPAAALDTGRRAWHCRGTVDLATIAGAWRSNLRSYRTKPLIVKKLLLWLWKSITGYLRGPLAPAPSHFIFLSVLPMPATKRAAHLGGSSTDLG